MHTQNRPLGRFCFWCMYTVSIMAKKKTSKVRGMRPSVAIVAGLMVFAAAVIMIGRYAALVDENAALEKRLETLQGAVATPTTTNTVELK